MSRPSSRETAYACPVCGTVHEHQSVRYKNHVCRDCEPKARCSHGQRVYGFNTHLGGGFMASHDRAGSQPCEQVTTDGRVWIDEVEYKMQEARFGGTVIVPLIAPVVVESIAAKVVWEQDGRRQFITGVDSGVYLAHILERPGPRRFLVREPSTWQWQVLNRNNRRVYKHGVERTETAAKDAAVAVLDAIVAYEARL